MSEEIVVKTESVAARPLEIIGSEIEILKTGARNMIAACEIYTKNSYIEIGKRLLEAKNSVEYGQYLPWLASVGYSEQTANNLIRIYTEMGNDDAFASLTYSQMRELLPLSTEQRKEVLPDAKDKSSREIKRLVAELKAAEKAKADAEQERDDAEMRLNLRDEELDKERKISADYFAAKTMAEGNLKQAKKDLSKKTKQAADLLRDAREKAEEREKRIKELEDQIKKGEKRDLTEREMAAIYKQVEKELATKQAKAEALSNPLLVELNIQLKELQWKVVRISELLGDLNPTEREQMVANVCGLIRSCLNENGLGGV